MAEKNKLGHTTRILKAGELREELQDALRRLVEERGISRTLLADRAGVSRMTLYHYLNGDADTSDDQTMPTIEKLSRALDVEPDYFIEYRKFRARKLAEQAVEQGLMEPDELARIIDKRRQRKRQQETAKNTADTVQTAVWAARRSSATIENRTTD